jgi:hypothetical protein
MREQTADRLLRDRNRPFPASLDIRTNVRMVVPTLSGPICRRHVVAGRALRSDHQESDDHHAEKGNGHDGLGRNIHCHLPSLHPGSTQEPGSMSRDPGILR